MTSDLQQRATELMVIYIKTKREVFTPIADNDIKTLLNRAELLGECLGILQGFLAIDDVFRGWVEQELLSMEGMLTKVVPVTERDDVN